MRRRKLWWVLAVLPALFVIVLVGTASPWPRPERVTPQNFSLIHKGMSRVEVTAMLGPPGDYSTLPPAPLTVGEPPQLDQDSPSDTEWETIDSVQYWLNDDLEITVYFDPNGVVRTECDPAHVIKNSTFGNLVWRAKRLWNKWLP
jgi:outer membrane protein assembly factor BamE (lipoprotein component of BamABCDE complex)